MFQKLPVEIKDMPVGVAFAKNRNESENVTFKAVAFAVCLDQAFPGQLGRAVKRRLNRKWCVLGGRDYRCFSINRTCRRKHNSFDPVRAHRLKDIKRRDSVLLQISRWLFLPEAHVGVGGKMKHCIVTSDRFSQGFEIKRISAQHFESGMLPSIFQEFFLAGGKIDPARDGYTICEKPVDKIRPNETGGASHENSVHRALLLPPVTTQSDTMRIGTTPSQNFIVGRAHRTLRIAVSGTDAAVKGLPAKNTSATRLPNLAL